MTEIKLTKRIKYAEDVYKELTERAGFPPDLASDFLNNVPDADAVEVVHGRWENYPGHIYRRCSLCKVEWEKPRFNIRANYCPNCGAKMDAKEE